MMDVLVNLSKLARLDKPIGILLLLWPTLSALWLASNGIPNLKILLIFIAGVLVMRSAGCVINDIADRDIDKHIERTKNWPLTSGNISINSALLFLFFLLLIALFLSLSLSINVMSWSVGGLILASVYPLCKRYISSPQIMLGITFSWSIPMAYVACGHPFDLIFFLLWAGVALWIIVYDTFYALVDIDDDKKTGVFSTAILFGNNVSKMTQILQFLTLICWGSIGYFEAMAWPYFLCLLIISLLFIKQQWLIKHKEKVDCFKAFNQSWYVGFLHFVGIFLGLSV